MPNTKLIRIGIIYKPPNQSNFLEIFEQNPSKLNTSYCETYFLTDFSINLFEYRKHAFDKSSSFNKNLQYLTKIIETKSSSGKMFGNFGIVHFAEINHVSPLNSMS